jgi:hypothetical protein
MAAAPDRPFSALTLAELKEQEARLNKRAAKLRAEQAHRVATTPSALALSRQLKDVSRRADDYAALVRMAQERGVET